jgi:glutamate dehydrogenase (NADP+)
MLKDKNDTLEGKRCLIIGSGKVARSVAAKLLEYGAIPITFSDMSGHVYEPDGMTSAKLKTISKIKEERGALLGRYIISSTTAEFNNPKDILDIPCDICFPCGAMNNIDEIAIGKLADNGCKAVIEGGHSAITPGARLCLKKRGILYGPHIMTLTGPAIVQSIGNGGMMGYYAGGLSSSLSVQGLDAILAEQAARIYKDVKHTASEFNVRGDLFAGANIMGFLRVANVMMTHGAV